MHSILHLALSVLGRYVFVVLALLIVAATVVAVRAARPKGRTRTDVMNQLAEAKKALEERPGDDNIRRKAAQLLYESGDFWLAAETIQPLLNEGSTTLDSLWLAAELKYLLGQYEEAEQLYQELLARSEGSRRGRIKAKVGLAMVYYQTNQFERAKELDLPRGAQFPNLDVMKSFSRPPYRLQWNEGRMTEIPFLIADPLPLVTVEYNGVAVHVLFDTGGDMCIVDTEVAKELGIKEITSSIGGFAGGKAARIGFGKLESVKIGDVTLKDVPVTTIATKRFSKGFADGKFPIGGIIGTGLIRQFLTTIDYENEKMILRERSHQAAESLRKQLEGRIAGEVPFVLSATHMMMATGSINDRQGLTFFVDSGLASEAVMTAPLQTLRYLGIPEPEKKIDPKSVGGGGGNFASGLFSIDSLGLGSLRQKNIKGDYGSAPTAFYWQGGFIHDGLISHGFLSQYASWTIDFDRFKYIFATERP